MNIEIPDCDFPEEYDEVNAEEEERKLFELSKAIMLALKVENTPKTEPPKPIEKDEVKEKPRVVTPRPRRRVFVCRWFWTTKPANWNMKHKLQ